MSDISPVYTGFGKERPPALSVGRGQLGAGPPSPFSPGYPASPKSPGGPFNYVNTPNGKACTRCGSLQHMLDDCYGRIDPDELKRLRRDLAQILLAERRKRYHERKARGGSPKKVQAEETSVPLEHTQAAQQQYGGGYGVGSGYGTGGGGGYEPQGW